MNWQLVYTEVRVLRTRSGVESSHQRAPPPVHHDNYRVIRYYRCLLISPQWRSLTKWGSEIYWTDPWSVGRRISHSIQRLKNKFGICAQFIPEFAVEIALFKHNCLANSNLLLRSVGELKIIDLQLDLYSNSYEWVY